MLHYLRLLLLAPILIYQGKRVRKITPVLPEPEGKRQWGCPRAKHQILLLGDSSAAGVGTTDQANALLGQLAHQLSAYDVAITLLAQTGATSADGRRWLHQIATQSYTAVITVFGVNHVVANHTQQRWIKEQNALFTDIQHVFDEAKIFACGLPPMHYFRALPQPLRWCLGRRAKAFDNALKRLTGAHPHIHYCAIEVSQSPEMLALDGFHPSEQGYQVWSQQLADQIIDTLSLEGITQ